MIRFATVEDSSAILAIYAPYIRDTVISFEMEVPTEEEYRQRLEKAQGRYPWFVAEEGSEIVGYAYAGQHRAREAYQWSVETSVYVARDRHRGGLGRQLYELVLEFCAELGYARAFAGITLPNDPSVRFHEAMGFEPIGVFRGIGYKFGAWRDVGWWQRDLGPIPAQPEPPRGF